jgi:hypothetical protein
MFSFSKYLGGENLESSALPPPSGGQSRLAREVIEHRRAIPPLLDRYLRQEKRSAASLFEDHPVHSDLDGLRTRDRARRRQHRNLDLEIIQFIGLQTREAGIPCRPN